MKTKTYAYLFTYLDKQGNELKSTILYMYSKKEAIICANQLFANCMIGDCVKVTNKKSKIYN